MAFHPYVIMLLTSPDTFYRDVCLYRLLSSCACNCEEIIKSTLQTNTICLFLGIDHTRERVESTRCFNALVLGTHWELKLFSMSALDYLRGNWCRDTGIPLQVLCLMTTLGHQSLSVPPPPVTYHLMGWLSVHSCINSANTSEEGLGWKIKSIVQLRSLDNSF